MNFEQAIEELKKGKKIRRIGWEEKNYLMVDEEDNETKNYYLSIKPYEYDQTIILSNDWVNARNPTLTHIMKWTEAIEALKLGACLKQKDWDTGYITLDKSIPDIVYCYYETCPFSPTYTCFVANDWEAF
jgi:hypothetical protein